MEFRGRLTGDGDRVEARFIPTDGGAATGWQEIDDSIRAGFFNGRIRVRSCHYTVELRVLLDGEVVGSQSVDGVGVGEVFIIAGQSNSANHGVPTLTPADPRVCSTDGSTWQTAADPQPIATGSGGSPWPAFGDLFAARYDVPVGIMSVGWGGTSVGQWLPGNERNLFSRLQFAADTFGEDGVRAVLWHQGESDSIINTNAADYASRLSTVIDAMRVHGGWAIPWGIARVGFLPNSPPERIAAVVDGQNMVIDSVPFVFAGPTTDDLVGEVWRYDAVHFNEMGFANMQSVGSIRSCCLSAMALQASSTPCPVTKPTPFPMQVLRTAWTPVCRPSMEAPPHLTMPLVLMQMAQTPLMSPR